MTRSILSGLLGLLSVIAVGSLPSACQSGGVGDPCTPEDEYNSQFAGFKVTEDNIESRSFQCQTRICLVNHFQGRVSCPMGQAPPAKCNGPGDTASCGGGNCVLAAEFAPECDPKQNDAEGRNAACGGGVCNQNGKFCQCVAGTNEGCPQDGSWSCSEDLRCKSYICENANGCQDGSASDSENKGKACCVPGTNQPVVSPVCGQCADDSTRNAEQAVYCSCRCGVADGEPDDPNFNFCECPTGFTCSEIRKNLGLGDEKITGKYCIKEGSEFKSERDCKTVAGYYDSAQCQGVAAPVAP